MIDLYRQFRQILAELELLSNVSAASYESNGHSIPHSTPPPGVRLDGGSQKPPYEYWRERWLRAVWSDHEAELRESAPITTRRRDVIEKAQADLDSYRKRTEGVVVGETEAELEARIVREGEGWSVEQVAQHCRCTVTFARKARLKAARSVETGKAPKDLVIDSDDDMRDRARKLKREGVSGRGIRLILKIGGSKLDQLLREAVCVLCDSEGTASPLR